MKFLSLEDELSTQIAVGAQPTATRLAVEELAHADRKCRQTLAELGSARDTLASIETMESYLGKQVPADIGRVGVMFANIAFEQLCQSHSISLEALPIDAQVYAREPENAMATAKERLLDVRTDIRTEMRELLELVLVTLAGKRETLNREIGQLWRAVADIERLLEAGEGQMHNQPVMRWQGFEDLVYMTQADDVGGVARFGCASVVPDVDHLMTEHSHLFKRLIKKQIDWINDHKDNLLKGGRQFADGFASYVFNPVEYTCNGQREFGATATGHPLGAKQVYQTRELPGMMAFYTFTAGTTKYGLAGLEEMMTSTARMANYSDIGREQYLEQIYGEGPPDLEASPSERDPIALTDIPRLSVTDCQARLQELKRGIRNLEHWSDIAYVKLWKDAYFEQEVMTELLRFGGGAVVGHVEQGLRLMANGVLQQLSQASEGVGQYVVKTYTALLTYIQLSLTAPEETKHA